MSERLPQPTDLQESLPLPWEQFSLADLVWETSNQRTISARPISIIFHNQPITLIATLDRPIAYVPIKEYSFILRTEDSLVESIIRLSYADMPSPIDAETGIARHDRAKLLPRGLGIALYEKMLDFIQLIANREQRTITHIVQRGNQYRNESIDPSKWRAIFHPLLRTHGYEPSMHEHRDIWTKTYTPVAKTSLQR